MTILQPITPEAKQWITDHVEVESWQWLGCGFAVDKRFIGHLIDSMKSYGLIPDTDFEVMGGY